MTSNTQPEGPTIAYVSDEAPSYDGYTGGFLTDEQRKTFEATGYLVIPNWWSAEVCSEIRDRVHHIVSNMDLGESRTTFTTRDNKHGKDAYFVESGDKIRFFWEEDAFDDKGDFQQQPSKCINKIGHALHDLDPVLQKYSYDKRIGMVCRELGVKTPLAVQSMYIFKQPRIGGKVSPHQDGTFLYTDPQSGVGFWWALEDCTLSNGCLWVVPGSQKHQVKRRFKRSPTGHGCVFEPPEAEEYDLEGALSLEVKAGTVVLLHNSVVHYSMPNKSDKSRHAYAIHVVEGADGCNYPKDNWLQRRDDLPFRELP